MIDANDRALLELTKEIGIITVTRENQSRIERLAQMGLLERFSRGYRITDRGVSALAE